jgi:hypothetical protein
MFQETREHRWEVKAAREQRTIEGGGGGGSQDLQDNWGIQKVTRTNSSKRDGERGWGRWGANGGLPGIRARPTPQRAVPRRARVSHPQRWPLQRGSRSG